MTGSASGDGSTGSKRKQPRTMTRFVALEMMQMTVNRLCAEMPYEFRVCGVNEMGEGIWSDASEPVSLPNPEKVRLPLLLS